MVRTSQGGSILSFLVIGGIMAVLLIGGAYAVRRSLTPVAQEPQAITSNTKPESPKPADNTKPKPEPDSKQPDGAGGSSSKPTPNTDTDNKQKADKPTPPALIDDSHPVSGLPTTGLSGELLGGIMISGLVALLVAYVESRRTHASL